MKEVIIINYSLDKLKGIRDEEKNNFNKAVRKKKFLLEELEELELNLLEIYDRLDNIDKTIKIIESKNNY